MKPRVKTLAWSLGIAAVLTMTVPAICYSSSERQGLAEIESTKALAEEGDIVSQMVLGSLYYKGDEIVPQDYKEALKWFTKAAERGVPVAQFNVGVMYSQGQGVARDDAEAVKWYRKAADQGHEDARHNLSRMEEKAKSTYDILMEHDRAIALAKQGKTLEQADQEAALALRKTAQADRKLDIAERQLSAQSSSQRQYEIQAAGNDETFVINGEVFKAKTYCMGWDEGDRILFIEGSPLGVCTSATLYNINNKKTCDVWCE